MALFFFLRHTAASLPLWLILLGALGLTYWECREQKYETKLTVWWLSLVLLLHVPGYLALRIWVAVQRNKKAA